MQTWLKAVLAISALGGGTVWAEGTHQAPQVSRDELVSPARTRVVRSPESGRTRVEVTSTQGFEPGAWVLVQPQEDGSSGPWGLAQVHSAGEQSLELSRWTASAPVELLAVSQQLEGSATAWLDRPRQGAQVPGRAVSVEGQVQSGCEVIIFVDGVEAARLAADDSGRFAGNLEKPLAPGSHQLQVVSGLEEAWLLHPEPVTVVSLAPPADPVVAEPANAAFTNDTTPLFRGTAQPGTRVIVAISGTDVGSTDVDAAGNWSLSLATALAEGTYSAFVRAESSGGEASGAVEVIFTVDTTPPNTSITQYPAEVTSSTSFTLRWTSTTGTIRYECKLDGGEYVACLPPYQLTELAEGGHSFFVRAMDRAGNVELEPASVTWSIDLTPPTIRVVNPLPEWSNAQNPVLELEASEVISRYYCKLDSNEYGFCDTEPSVPLFSLTEGPHVLEIYASDRVGFLSPTMTYRWNVDLTPPPTPVLVQPSAGVLLNSRTPVISGTAEPESVVKVIVNGTEIGSTNVSASGNWSFDWAVTPTGGLMTGSYELALVGQDRAGNGSTGTSPTAFRVDVDRPETFITEGPEAIIREARPTFRFSSTEEGVVYECSVNEQPFGACDELVAGSRSFEPGSYTLRVRARDVAGNEDETPDSRTWTYSTFLGSGGGLSGCSASGASPLLPLVPLLAFLKRRRSRSRREMAGGSALLALLTVFQSGSVRAQGVDLQQYKPAPGSRDVLGVYSPQVDPGVGLHAGLSVSYARNPLVLRTATDGGFAQSIVSDQVTADVLASVSFLNYFELGLALPVTGQWGPAPGALGVFIPENATGTGLGDLRLVPKAVFPLGETLSLGAATVVSLPTANSQSFFGTGGVGVQPMLLAQWDASQQLRVLANVGGRFQPANQVPLLRLNVGNELTYALGAHWSGANSKFFVQGSLEGAVALDDAQSSAIPLELLAAVGYSLPGGMAVRLGGGPGLTSGYGTPNFRLFASLSWSSGTDDDGRERRLCTGKPDADADGDGVLNAGDLCPYAQGDRGDGCPRGGGPERVNALAQLFKNDSDKDGLLDDADACPNQPGVTDLRGCPLAAQAVARESESTTVTLSFPSGKPKADSPKKLDTVVARVQELLKNNQLAEVQASFPPEQAGATLMQQRAASVKDYLAQRIPELKNPDKLKMDSKGMPVRRSGGKELLDIKFTFVSPNATNPLPPPPELKCTDQGVAARLMGFHGEVTAGSENKLESLTSEAKVCDGDLVKTGQAAGAVLVLSEGTVLRLAPDSQVKLSRKGVQVLQGTMEPQASLAALAAPEILPPCKGSISGPAMISWQAVPGARRYWVQVARGVDFDSDPHFILTESTGASLALLERGTWYWRVLPVDEKGLVGKPSKIHAFEVVEAAVGLKG